MPEVADLIVKVTRVGISEADAELGHLGDTADDTGEQAFQASISWDALKRLLAESGQEAVKTAVEMMGLGEGANYASDQVDQLSRSLIKANLLRGGGLGGGPPGKGLATDMGSFFRQMQNVAAGALSALLLVVPTVNVIIAGLIGIVSLLSAALIAATAFAVAIGAVGAAMALSALKWRELWTQSTDGVDHMRGALLAVEAASFDAFQRIRDAFSTGAGGNIWDTLAEGAITAIAKMEPYIQKFVGWLKNLIDSFNGVNGASSPFLDWMKQWLGEWRNLQRIVGEGLPQDGAGFFGFLEKYRRPAEAFVEGIARVVNAIRKMSAMGLGLNMDQLAEFIRNVFEALAQLIQVFPRFSNALVTVGLEVSRFILAIMPIAEQAIIIGEAILKNLVAPLVNAFLKVLQTIMRLPILSWLIAFAGGITLVALGLSKLSFGLLTFQKLITGSYLLAVINFTRNLGVMFGLMAEGNGIVASFGAMFPRFSAAVGKLATMFTGLGEAVGRFLNIPLVGATAGWVAFIAVIVIAAATILAVKKGLADVAELNKVVEDTSKDAWDAVVAGTANGTRAFDQVLAAAQESYDKMSLFGKGVFTMEHLFELATNGANPTLILARQSLDALAEGYDAVAQSAADAVRKGLPFEGELLKQIRGLQAVANQGIPGPKPGQPGLWGTTTGATEATDAYVNQQHAAESLLDIQKDLDAQFAAGVIDEREYASYMDALNHSTNAAGVAVDVMGMKVRGAANDMAEAILSVRGTTEFVTGDLRQFAEASGQTWSSFRADAIEAINDVTGQKLTEFFQKQQQVIQDWKATYADAFNTVRSGWEEMGSDASLTLDGIVSTMRGHLTDMRQVADDMQEAIRRGFSREVIQDIASLPFEQQANLWDKLKDAPKSYVDTINRIEARSMGVAFGAANNVASAIGLTMRRLARDIEYMMATSLGISMEELHQRVRDAVAEANGETAKLKDRTVRISYKILTGRPFSTWPGHDPSKDPAYPSPVGTVPTPDTKTTHDNFATVSKSANQGLVDGFAATAGTVKTAAEGVANEALKGAKEALGIRSPSTAFAAVGRDAVAGLVSGLAGVSVYTKFFALGQEMVNGLKDGVSIQMLLFRFWWGIQLAGIVQMARDTFKTFSPSRVFYDIGTNIGEGMRLGLGRGMGRVRADMAKHAQGLMSDWDKVRTHVRQRGLAPVGVRDAGWGYTGGGNGVNEGKVRGTLAFDWRRGQADLQGAMAWENRNAL